MAVTKTSIAGIRKQILQSGYNRRALRIPRKRRYRPPKTALMYDLEHKFRKPMEQMLLEGSSEQLAKKFQVSKQTVCNWWAHFEIEPMRYRIHSGKRGVGTTRSITK